MHSRLASKPEEPYFLDLVQEYDRVALGGLAIKTIQTHEYKYLPWFVETAHRHHAKIHGLGFSSTRHLPWIPFDSVDSTSCWSGGRFGTVYQFDGKSIRKVAKSGELGMRARLDEVEMHNVKEWIKYVHYLDQKY
ncbi:MAG: hypothetical protein WB502_16030 [Thermoactinomyces sp.]